MNHDIHTAPTQVMQPEVFTLPPEYDFMSVENMKQLRAQQCEIKIAANGDYQQQVDDVDADAESYVSTHLNREDDPELFDKLTHLVAGASYFRTSNIEWSLGKPDQEGKHNNLETSGRSHHQAALEELFGNNNDNDPPAPEPEPIPDPEPEPDPLPPLPDPESIQTAEAALTGSRKQLAELSVQRRRLARKGSKKAKALEAQFTEATEVYEAARVAMGKLHVQAWEHQGQDPLDVRANVVKLLLNEHQSFTKAEMEVLAKDESRIGKVSRFMARHKWLFAGASGVVGAGIGIGLSKATKGAVAGALGLAGAAVLPATLAGGAAVKTTKAVLQSSFGNRVHQHRTHDKRSAQDHAHLASVADQYISHTQSADEMLTSASGLLSGTIHNRVHKDVRSNRNRVIGSAAIGGAAGIAGFLAASELGNSWPLGEHTNNNVHSAQDVHMPQISYEDTQNISEHPKPGVVDGYQTHVRVESGHGYTQELADLAHQKNINLTGTQSWELYEHLNDKFHGQFFTNNPSYHMNNPGEWGISRPGASHWDPSVIREMDDWMDEHGYRRKIAKKAAQAALSNR